MHLLALFDELVNRGEVPESRKGPAKTAIRQYAKMLGYQDPAKCEHDAYNLSESFRKALIEGRAKRSYKDRKNGHTELGARAVINIKNNISFVLKKAVARNLILSPEAVKPLSEANRVRNRVNPKGFTYFTPGRKEFARIPTYALTPKNVPHRLASELKQYYLWTTMPFNPQRPERRKRRKISADGMHMHLLYIAGFLVNIQGYKKEKLTIWSLAQPEYAEAYISWFLEARNKATTTLQQRIIAMRSIAAYLEIVASSNKKRAKAGLFVQRIKTLQERLPAFEKVVNKKERWLSLEQIDSVGQSIYPLSEKRIEEFGSHRTWSINKILEGGKVPYHSGKRNALWAGQSLLIRMMVRLPLRQRNYREMCWNPGDPSRGKNLYRDGNKWFIRFSGKELKINFRRGKENSIIHQVPQELNDLLEEYLLKWRPILTGVPYSFDRGVRANYVEPSISKAPPEKRAPNDAVVFVNEQGRPAGKRTITDWLEKATYKFTGIALNPHLIRDIWATTYIKRTRDFIGAAKRLGSLVETVLRDYADLLDDEAEENANAFNNEIFGIAGNHRFESGKVNETAEVIIHLLNLKRKLLLAGISEDEILKLLKSS